MKILGLDSSGLVASVAVVQEGNLLAEYTVNYKKTHSQTLLPMLDEIVRMTELDLNEIDAIAVAAGARLFYRAAHWFRYCQRIGVCAWKAVNSHSDCRWTGLQSVGQS